VQAGWVSRFLHLLIQPVFNMLSKRLLNLIVDCDKISTKLGVVAGHFNPKTQTFYYDPRQEWKVKLNYALLWLWAFGGSCIVFKYKRFGDADRYNMTLAYILAGVLMLVIYSIIRWYTQDFLLVGNQFFNYLRHIQGKFVFSISIVFRIVIYFFHIFLQEPTIQPLIQTKTR